MTPNPKQQFLDAYGKEHATTMKVVRAFPSSKHSLRPHPKCKTAGELAWMFVMEQDMAEKALTSGFDWAKPPSMPPAPDSMETIIGALDAGYSRIVDLVKTQSEAQLTETVKFPVAPKTLGDIPRLQLLWFMLCDQIHHRGQFSIYLRMADGRVPSIYGPSLDEPWM